MDYEAPPDPAEIEWKIGEEGRAWEAGEAFRRRDLAPHKTELIYGKLYCTDTSRLCVLGLLLENCGAEAAVRMGDPEVWRKAVASLDDPESNLRFAVLSALRRRDDLSEHDPAGAIRFYEQVTTDDYVEQNSAENPSSIKIREDCLAEWRKRSDDSGPGYDHTKSTLVRIQREGETGIALVQETRRRYRYAATGENRWEGLPPVNESALWRESWRLTPEGWRLYHRECMERFETPA